MGQWIIDTDGGIDDAQALVLALRTGPSYDFSVAAVTVVAGNVTAEQACKNVGECLYVTDRCDVPVFVGANRPLVATVMYASHVHGEDGLGGYWTTVPQHSIPVSQQESAVSAIIRLASASPKTLSIVTIGPLTNLALAVLLDPDLPQKLDRIVIMGAAETGNGNTNKTAEFNIFWDPEAAAIVFDRFSALEIVSWECTIDPKNEFPGERLKQYLTGDTKVGKFIKDITQLPEGFEVIFCDPMALAVAMNPSIVKEDFPCVGWVSLGDCYTEGSFSRGRTYFKSQDRSNTRLVKAIDIPVFCEMLMQSIR
jgi:purine nucleosidase